MATPKRERPEGKKEDILILKGSPVVAEVTAEPCLVHLMTIMAVIKCNQSVINLMP